MKLLLLGLLCCTVLSAGANPCKPNPCQHGGRCAVRGGKFSCNCVGRWEGSTCRMPGRPKGPCDSKPCKNGGQCFEKYPNGYSCNCKQGYLGTNCQRKVRSCSSNPCLNGGKCNPMPKVGYTCSCVGEFEGRNCGKRRVIYPGDGFEYCLKVKSKPAKRDESNPTWLDTFLDKLIVQIRPIWRNHPGFIKAEFRSQAKIMLEGAVQLTIRANIWMNSKIPINELIQHYVKSSKPMSRFLGIPTVCGKLSPEPNQCRANLCHNGGYCIPKVGGYLCACRRGYEGENCLIAPKHCVPNPCRNDGNCMPKDGGYVCTCKDGYSGENCEIGPNYCLPNPCLNGGKCMQNVYGYLCTCKNGYDGEICQSNRGTCPEYNAKMIGLVGVMIFDCNADGTYKRKQCYEDLNQCYCVNPLTGTEIDGTRMRSVDFNLDCTKQDPRIFPKDSCGYVRMEKRKNEESMNDGMVMVGTYIPTCDLDGKYKLKQCHPSSGYCWCVEKMTGKEIDGTRAGPRLFAVDCESVQPDSGFHYPDMTAESP